MNRSQRQWLRGALCALVAAASIAAATRAADYRSTVYIDNQSDRPVLVSILYRPPVADGSDTHLIATWCARPHTYDHRDVHGATNRVLLIVTEEGCRGIVYARHEMPFRTQGEITRWRYLITGSDDHYGIEGPLDVR